MPEIPAPADPADRASLTAEERRRLAELVGSEEGLAAVEQLIARKVETAVAGALLSQRTSQTAA